MVKVVPRLLGPIGPQRTLVGGLLLALLWLSRLSTTTDYWTGVTIPMAMIGVGMGLAFTPRTQAAIAGFDNHDAGAASGLVNAFQQLGSTIGIGVLVTVFAAASEGSGATALAEGVPTTIEVSAALIALALAVVLGVMRPRLGRSPAPLPAGRDRSRPVIRPEVRSYFCVLYEQKYERTFGPPDGREVRPSRRPTPSPIRPDVATGGG